MTHFRRLIALALAAMLLTTVFTLSASAATWQPAGARRNAVTTLKVGKWYGTNAGTLKVKLSRDSVVTAKWKNGDGLSIGISRSTNSGSSCGNFRTQEGSGKDALALKKGIYYINIYASDDTTKVSFAVDKLVDRKNYCPANAVLLKRNVKYTSAQIPMKLANRIWFKIKTTKKQKISIMKIGDNHWEPFGEILDSDLNWLSCSYSDDIITTSEAVPAGTYYISYGNAHKQSLNVAETLTVWWK